MKISRDTIIAILCIVVVAMGAILIYQYQMIQRVAQGVMAVNDKADQSNLAAGVALQQTAELVEGQQANQQKMLEQWNQREPIGFKSQKNQNV